MDKIRFGIIGCGVIAPTHIWAIEENDNAQLTALCDNNEKRLKKLAKGKDVRTYTDWKEMLASSEIDAVTICLPHYLHAPAFIDALAAGKHVLCEKPMGVNLKQLQSMKKAAVDARKNGIISGGIFQHRFSPLIEEVMTIVREGELGTLEGAELNFLCTRDKKYYAADAWRGKWETEGGGLLINQAIHTMDLLIQLIGLPRAIEANLYREKLDCIEVEDRSNAVFYYGPEDRITSGKVKLTLENDLKTNWQPDIILKGSKAVLELKGSEEFICSDTSLTERLTPFAGEEGRKAPGKACYGSLHSQNFANFIESVIEKREPRITMESQADSTEAVLAVYQAHFQNKQITLPLTDWKEPQGLNKA
jgi:UDP-N-acetyl-2-amino-2-deoxyglucuronate dehydrogenase